jgi:hypothetical protein
VDSFEKRNPLPLPRTLAYVISQVVKPVCGGHENTLTRSCVCALNADPSRTVIVNTSEKLLIRMFLTKKIKIREKVSSNRLNHK